MYQDKVFKQVQETCKGINLDEEAREEDHEQRRGQPIPPYHFRPASCDTKFVNIYKIQEARLKSCAAA